MSKQVRTSVPTSAGFAFLELLLVLAMIGLISAISLPALARARVSANEASAIANLQGIIKAQIAYQTAVPNSCGSLGDLIAKGLLPDALADGELSGYSFSLSDISPNCQIMALPVEPGISGSQIFIGDTQNGIQGDNQAESS